MATTIVEQMIQMATTQPLTASPIPAGVSTGKVMCGIGVTAMGSIGLMQAGIPIPYVFWDPYAPIVGPR